MPFVTFFVAIKACRCQFDLDSKTPKNQPTAPSSGNGSIMQEMKKHKMIVIKVCQAAALILCYSPTCHFVHDVPTLDTFQHLKK